MKTAKEILESKFGNPLSDYVGEDQLWIIDNIVEAMKEYAEQAINEDRHNISSNVKMRFDNVEIGNRFTKASVDLHSIIHAPKIELK